MRTFFRDHWKAIVAIILLVLLALFTVNPSAAIPEPALAERLRAHVMAIAPAEHEPATPAELEAAARYIENTLQTEGYRTRRQEYQADGPHGPQLVRNIEVSVARVAPDAKPARIFIVGAHCGSGTAAVLELARLLKDMRPSQGTEVKFVFFVDEAPGPEGRYLDTGNFIAFVGTLESSRLVQDSLAAFRNVSNLSAHGLAAPAYVQGVRLSDHSSYPHSGYPAIVFTDTAFMRYPYYHTAQDTPERIDYQGTARVVAGLARTIVALAGETRS